MVAFVFAPLFYALFMMGFYADFTMLEPPQVSQSVSILALPTLKTIQAASELACTSGCQDGPMEVSASAIPISVTGTFGTGSMSGIVISWFVAVPPSAGQALYRPTTDLDAATKSVIGTYSLATGLATGVQTYSETATAPPMSFAVSPALGIPDGAIILTERRLP